MLLSDLERLCAPLLVPSFFDSYVGKSVDFIDHLSESSRAMIPAILRASGGGDVLSQVQAMHEALRKAKEDIKLKIQPATLFDDIRLLTGKVANIAESLPPTVDRAPLQLINQTLLQFRGAYEEFIKHQQSDSTINLMVEANRVLETIKAAGYFTALITSCLDKPDRELPHDYDTLNIRLDYSVNIGGLIDKLIALREVYNATAQALDVNPNERPLGFVRIESGTIGLLAVGDAATVYVVGAIVLITAGWIYRQLAHGGAVNGMNLKRELVEGGISLKQSLDGAGVDTSGLAERLQIAGEKYGDHLIDLLGGSQEVRVNQVEVRLIDSIQSAYAESPGQLPVTQYDPQLKLTDQRKRLPERPPTAPEGEGQES